MSRLRIFAEDDHDAELFVTHEGGAIAARLAEIGVRFERWPIREVSSHAPADILNAYAPEIEPLKAEGGFLTVDVASVTPDHPDRHAMREKFLSEHTHSEGEIRFFVSGQGLFTLRHEQRVFEILCTAGDLISVPAGMRHWFDMGTAPSFTAIRLFVNPDGWVAKFTGDAIADRFARLEPV